MECDAARFAIQLRHFCQRGTSNRGVRKEGQKEKLESNKTGILHFFSLFPPKSLEFAFLAFLAKASQKHVLNVSASFGIRTRFYQRRYAYRISVRILLRVFGTRYLIMPLSFGSITAVFHVAPLATAIPTHIEKQPATVLSLALADSVQLVRG